MTLNKKRSRIDSILNFENILIFFPEENVFFCKIMTRIDSILNFKNILTFSPEENLFFLCKFMTCTNKVKGGF